MCIDLQQLQPWFSGIAAIGAVGSAGAAGYTAWMLRRSSMADMALRLADQFDGEEMRKKRRAAARRLLKKDYTQDDDIDDVLDFFETLGFLVRRKAIDEEIVWHSFFWWLHRYWVAAEPYILHYQREGHSSAWIDLKKVHDIVVAVELENDPGSSDLQLQKDSSEILKFLSDEEGSSPVYRSPAE